MTDNIDRLIDQADLQLRNGHIDNAINTLKQILSIEPDNAWAHAWLSIALLDMRRIYAAEHEAQIALSLDPLLLECHLAQFHVAMAHRKFKQARKHLDFLLEREPNNAQFFVMAAQLNELSGRKGEILSALEKALELDPEDADIPAALSRYYLDRGDRQKAHAMADNALRMAPENTDALVAMGYVLLDAGQTTEAREHAVWALRNAPEDTGALALISAIKMKDSLFTGLWWRFNSWMNQIGSARAILVLLGAFFIYRAAVITMESSGNTELASVIRFVWLGLVIYTFVGPAMYQKALKKEMMSVRLSNEY